MIQFQRGIDPKVAMGIGPRKYSRQAFEGYRCRAQVQMDMIGEGTMRMDVYTDETDRDKAEEELNRGKKSQILNLRIVFWTTKEYDDASCKLIEDWIKDS
jgi:hypothetical protein